MKYGIQVLSVGWICSGIASLILGLLAENSNQGEIFALVFIPLGVFFVYMDIREYKKKERLRS